MFLKEDSGGMKTIYQSVYSIYLQNRKAKFERTQKNIYSTWQDITNGLR